MEDSNKDVLVVVSKLKTYIKNTTGLSTASTVPEILSDAVKMLCETAVEKAKKDGRKTLMDRDFDLTALKTCATGQTTLKVAS
jgi:histone H3/H4